MNENSSPLALLQLHLSTRGLSEDAIASIAKECEVVRCAESEVLLQPNQPIDALYLVCTGQLVGTIAMPGGVEKSVSFATRDDQIGILAILQESDGLQAKVTADQPSILLRVPREAAVRLLEEHPLWTRNLMRILGPQMRNTLIGARNRQRKRLVSFIHMSPKTCAMTIPLVEQLTSFGEQVGLISDRQETLALETTRSLNSVGSDGKFMPTHEFQKIVGGWSDVERIVFDCQYQSAADRLFDLIVACGTVYFVCDSKSTENVISVLREFLKQSPTLVEKICVIRVLNRDEQVAPLAPGLSDVCTKDFKYHWDGCNQESIVCTQYAGQRRILHHLRGVSVGLALGGGAARGMAHLGVLQVMDEAGISIDCLTGTSAGALTGIPFAAGYTADFLVNAFATDLQPGWPYTWLPYGDSIYVLAKYRFGGWDPMLRVYLNDWKLEQLPLQFASVTVDLISAAPVVRTTGDATTAVLESINLPGIARPICADGKALVDGGVLDNLPADIAINLGANFVIASDVSAKICFEFGGMNSDTPTEKMKRPSGTASLIRMRTVQDRSIRAIGGSHADITIEPDISTVQLTDFKIAGETAKLGRTAAEEVLPQLKSVLHEMDPQLFP
ncbi:NTE family protein RssA [Planctomycetes bacterium CA13]|uniref:NTE family protein RssA n=1 Tax=Novipirellula herctigrandis TaxID=2527986 RepID=A0A5C5Z2F1_9BACT|nr:NTE family protein RssA [Planctomycetes bacterium CA13]